MAGCLSPAKQPPNMVNLEFIGNLTGGGILYRDVPVYASQDIAA